MKKLIQRVIWTSNSYWVLDIFNYIYIYIYIYIIDWLIRIHVYYEFKTFVCKLCTLHPSSLSTCLRSLSSFFIDEVSPRQNGSGATMCPSYKMAGDNVSPQQNGWRWNVTETKWLPTKCFMSSQWNSWRQSVLATKWWWQKGVYPSIFIQPSIKVFVFEVAHYFHKVILSRHHYVLLQSLCPLVWKWCLFESSVKKGPSFLGR